MRACFVGFGLILALTMPIAKNLYAEAFGPEAEFARLRCAMSTADSLLVTISGTASECNEITILNRDQIRELAAALRLKAVYPHFGACACRERTTIGVYKNGSEVASFTFRGTHSFDYRDYHFVIDDSTIVDQLREIAEIEESREKESEESGEVERVID